MECNGRSLEIQNLKAQNVELLNQIKEFSQVVDLKMQHAKKKAVAPADPQAAQELLATQLDCAKKKLKTYERELEALKQQLAARTGVDKVAEREAQLGLETQRQEELQKKVRELRKNVKVSGKIIAQGNHRLEEGIPQVEVPIEETRGYEA